MRSMDPPRKRSASPRCAARTRMKSEASPAGAQSSRWMKNHPRARVNRAQLIENAFELPPSHRLVGLVMQPRQRLSFLNLPHDAAKLDACPDLPARQNRRRDGDGREGESDLFGSWKGARKLHFFLRILNPSRPRAIENPAGKPPSSSIFPFDRLRALSGSRNGNFHSLEGIAPSMPALNGAAPADRALIFHLPFSICHPSPRPADRASIFHLPFSIFHFPPSPPLGNAEGVLPT